MPPDCLRRGLGSDRASRGAGAYDSLLSQLPTTSDSFFPNLRLHETTDETAFFDVRSQNGCPWAAPMQTYLELMTGEKRDRETAEQLRSLLLREL